MQIKPLKLCGNEHNEETLKELGPVATLQHDVDVSTNRNKVE